MGFGDDSKVKWVWILFHPYLIPSGLFLILFFHSVPLFSAEVLALPKENGDALLWFIFSPLNDFLKYLSHTLLSLCLREKASSFFIIPRLFIISWPLNCAVACSASSSDSSWLPTSFILLYVIWHQLPLGRRQDLDQGSFEGSRTTARQEQAEGAHWHHLKMVWGFKSLLWKKEMGGTTGLPLH